MFRGMPGPTLTFDRAFGIFSCFCFSTATCTNIRKNTYVVLASIADSAAAAFLLLFLLLLLLASAAGASASGASTLLVLQKLKTSAVSTTV